MRKPRKHRLGTIVAVLLGLYVGSYYDLSRTGSALARRAGFRGLYFCVPENTTRWRVRNYGCVCFYYYPGN